MRSINNTSIFSIESSIFVYVHDVCFKMVIGAESKRLVMSSNSLDENTDDFDSAVGHIIASLAKVFPDVSTVLVSFPICIGYIRLT